MKKTQLKYLRLLFLICLLQQTISLKAQQVYVNKEWRSAYGDPVFNPLLAPYGGDWTKSIIAANGEVITVAHTFVSGQGENVLLTRFDDSGTPIWQVDYNSSSSYNDYGINLIEDSNGDIYVCGTTDKGVTNDFDVLILIFDSNGNLIYDTRFDGPDGKNDIPSGITLDGSGNIIIAGTSESNSTSYDYLVLSYDLSLNLNWSNTYDYNSLFDFAAGVVYNGKIVLAGASANSATDWDMTTVEFDESTGAFQSDNRVNYPGLGYDEVYSFKRDANDNTYITGKASSNGTNYNIRTAKIDSTNTLVWAQSYDAFGLEDVGTTLAVDANGNVIVGGFITKSSNNKKDMIVLKYNSSGALMWAHNQSSQDPNSDALVKAVTTNPITSNIYYISGDKELGGNKRTIVSRLESSNGEKSWEKYVRGNYDYLPSDIQYGGLGANGIYAIAIKDSTVMDYELNYFTEHDKDTAMIYTSGGLPISAKSHLIVCFDTSAIIKPTINNKNIVAGDINDFIKSNIVSEIKDSIATIYGTKDIEIKVFKIFPEFTTSNTITISRLGETIPVPEFYSVLLLQFPNTLSITSAANTMLKLFPKVKYTDLNFVCTFSDLKKEGSFPQTTKNITPQLNALSDFQKTAATSANDSLYPNQSGLHNTSFYSNVNINAEYAWDYEYGKRYIKVGVYDTGINWYHPEFMDSTRTVSKIRGWDFQSGVDLLSQPPSISTGDAVSHGTEVSGIIGANRNSSKGIAGLAGGKFKQSTFLDSSGVFLHGLKIVNATNTIALIADFSKAIIGTSIDNPFNSTYEYGVHVQNHSWRVTNNIPQLQVYMTDTNLTLLREAVHFANRAHVTFVGGTGNWDNDAPCYPPMIDDDWSIMVGSNDENGKRAAHSNYKNNIDLMAPGVPQLCWTTLPFVQQFGSYYTQAGGTSIAAPHVAAAAGLLMSYYNKPYADPSNLAPEDVEFILQKTATDMTSITGYDDTTGWGRLNIGNALKMLEKPQRKVKHIGTNNSSHYTTKTLINPNDTVIKLTERFKNAAGVWFLPNIKYHVKTYEIHSLVQLNLTSTETILHYWSRHSSTNTFEPPVTGKLRPRERTTTFINNNQFAACKSYVYKVRDSLGNFLGWWPLDTTNANLKLTFSVLVKDTAPDVGISNTKALSNSLKVYPNPTNGNQILEITIDKNTNCKVDIYDMLGRNVLTLENIKTNEGLNKIPIPTNQLPNGMYIYNVKLEEERYIYKVLKQ